MNQQQGLSLIEALVAVVVLALGLLGLAGLQATSIKSNDSALFRSQATLLAYDMADRMRTMRTAALDGRFDEGSSHAERTTWDRAIRLALGADATGTIGRNNNVATIAITWNDNRGQIRRSSTTAAPNQQFTYVTEF